MKDLRMILVLLKREFLGMTKEPSRLMGIVLQPLLFWAVIGFGLAPSFQVQNNANLDYQSFFFVGILAMVLLFSAIFSTITLIEDKASGFMQAVLVAPGSRLALVLGKVLGVTLLATLQAFLLLGVGFLCGLFWPGAFWFLVLGVLLFGAYALGVLGFIFAWGTSSASAYHALMGIILIPLWILSGGMFPPDAIWMQWAVLLNPVAWVVAALRAALAGGVAPVGSVSADLSLCHCLLALLLFNCVATLLAVKISKR